jgi:hypothetical protein
MLQRISIAFRRGGVEEPRIMLVRDLKHGLCPNRTDTESLERKSQVFGWACRRGEVKDVVYVPKIERLADVSLVESEARLIAEVAKVLEVARRAVINPNYVVSFPEQPICQVRAKKAGSAGNENATHGAKPPQIGNGPGASRPAECQI